MKRTLVSALGLLVFLGLAARQDCMADAGAWQPVPGPYGGSYSVLALSPAYADDHTLFAGVRGRGIYRTTNGGMIWNLVSPEEWVVTALVLSPAYAEDETLFAAQGLWTGGYSVYRSTDAGDSWQAITPVWTDLPDPPGLAISPEYATDRTLYVLGGAETYRSTDGGDTFVEPGGWFDSHAVAHLAFSPAFADDRTLFALVPDDGLYKSIDGGDTWSPTGLVGTLSTFAVSPDYAADETLLAVGATDGQLYISSDGGGTWSPGSLVLGVGGQHTLLFSPSFGPGDRVILAASSVDPVTYHSGDGGETWHPAAGEDLLGGAVLALALAPADAADSAAFAGTNAGLYGSSNRGASWFQSRGQGLPRLTVRALAIDQGDQTTFLAGTSYFHHLRFDTTVPGEYDGSLQRYVEGQLAWRDVSGRLDRVRQVAVSPRFANDGIAFAATGTLGQHGYADGGVYRSSDGGATWTEVLGDRICQALALSPSFANDGMLWVSTATYATHEGLRVSTDGGDTWSPLAPAVHASILVPSPNYLLDQTLFAGTPDAGLQRSTDGGSSWSGVLDHPVTALAVSPAYGASQTLYAGVRASPDAPGDVYRSTDGGETWQLLETGIPDSWNGQSLTISALEFAVDGSVLAGLYYGHEAGGGAVYRSTDGGETWQLLQGGLESYSVFALATVPSGSLTVYVGTNGGLWQLEVPQGGPAEPGTWESNGPRGGRAQALAVSPGFTLDGVALAGEYLYGRHGEEYGLGIFRSSDSGQTWQSSSAGTEGIWSAAAVHDFAFSPDFVTDRTVFAATWGGLFKSTDGGAQWDWIFFGLPGSVTAVAVAPDYPVSRHVLASSGWSGLYVSGDGGRHWIKDLSVWATADLAYSPEFAVDGVAFAAGSRLYRTADRGLSWTEVLTQGISSLAVSPAFGVDGTVFAGGDALYFSYDGGTTWISSTLPFDAPRIDALALSPAYPSDPTLFAGTNSGLYRSYDGGLSWEPVAGYPGLAVRALALSPGWPDHPVLLVGTDEGVYRTGDGGVTWVRAEGMAPLATGPLALSAGEGLLVTGTSQHGIHGTTDGGDSWFPLGLQDRWAGRITGVALSPAYPADGTMFAVVLNTMSIGANLYRTADGGHTWEPVYSTGYLGPSLALSPAYASDRTAFAARDGAQVLRSVDGGDTWSEVGVWPPGTYYPAQVVALPPDYPADGSLFAAGDGFWRLPGGATTWEPAASGLYSNTHVASLAVSPSYAADRTLLATARRQEDSLGPFFYDVFRSTDGGQNWQPSGTGLPDVELGHVTFSPRYPQDHLAYLTAGDQLYRSVDGGLRWTMVGAPPDRPVLYDQVSDSGGVVQVASEEGVWHYYATAWDILVNGGFEAESGWDLPVTARPAGYTTRVAYDSRRSLRVGIVNKSNAFAYSSARQLIAIPANAIRATLHSYVYPVSSGGIQAPQGQAFQGEVAVEHAPQQVPAAGDAQYLLLLDPETGGIVQTLFWELSNAQGWQHWTFDLTPYAGQTLRLYFGVYNDGAGGQAGMFVDNAALVVERPAPEEPAYFEYLPAICRGCP